MTKTKVIFIVSFLLAFAAGTSLGVLAAKPGEPPRHRSWLASELSLTPEQRDQMGKIWSEVMGSAFRQQQGERRSALAQERDQAIRSLLSADQRTRYDAIQQDYSRKAEELSQQRKRAFDEAVERTKKILTPAQAAKYEELMKKQRERGGSGSMRGLHRHDTASSAAATTSRPASGPGGQ